MLKKKLLPSLTLAFVAALLSSCGGSDTNIVEREPIPIEDDHDHDHDEILDKGRLLIAAKNNATVSIIDLEESEPLETFTITEPASSIYASHNYRYGFVMQRNANTVNVVDGGLWQEDHGDHMDDYREAPLLMNFHTDEVRPTHLTSTAEQSAIFYDGNVNTSTPAAVAVITESTIANNSAPVWLEYTTHMHGAAQARGDYLLSTVRDPESSSTLPDRVALYLASDNQFEELEVFAEMCPGLHGSAQNETAIAFGCTDGVLVITQNGTTFSATKIVNPDIFTEGMRIGTLVGDAVQDHFIGIASGKFFLINITDESFTPIEWLDTSAETTPSALSYGFADEGELFAILDNQGWLTLLSTEDWSVTSRIQSITSNLAALPEGNRFELALTPGHMAYVSDPIANQIKQIDLDHEEVTQTIQLDFVPSKFTWLGVAEPAEDDHDH